MFHAIAYAVKWTRIYRSVYWYAVKYALGLVWIPVLYAQYAVMKHVCARSFRPDLPQSDISRFIMQLRTQFPHVLS